jgi:hypothetical protein
MTMYLVIVSHHHFTHQVTSLESHFLRYLIVFSDVAHRVINCKCRSIVILCG